MTAGIAALIVAGISIKKICDFAVKNNNKQETENAFVKSNEVQRLYRSYLVEDLATYKTNSIRDRLAGRKEMRKQAILDMGLLLTDSIKQENV